MGIGVKIGNVRGVEQIADSSGITLAGKVTMTQSASFSANASFSESVDFASSASFAGKVDVTPKKEHVGVSPYKLQEAITGGETFKSSVFAINEPGFHLVSGSTTTTGTIPAADRFPGAMIVIGRRAPASGPFMLTGSARVSGVNGVFAVNTVVSGTVKAGSAYLGDKLTVDDGQGGLMLLSDSRQWQLVTISGSYSIA